MVFLTLSAVPTGTVLLSITTLNPESDTNFPRSLATANIYCKSALPSSPGGVGKARTMMSAPVTAHRQKMFESFGGADYELPVTDWLTERVISLPIHTELDEEQQQFICDAVLEFLN